MTTDDGDLDAEKRLREARARLSAADAADGRESRGEGEAADGWVRAVAVDGRLDEIVLNPRTMRWDVPKLTERLTTAINAALGGARIRESGADEAVIDPAVLAGRLRDVHDEGMRMLAVISQGLDLAITKIPERASAIGSPAIPHGFEALLEQTRAMAASAARSDTPEEHEPRGTGRDPSDQVIAVTVPDGRVESLEIGSRALRAGSAGVAEAVMAAVNAALDDLRERGTVRTGAMNRNELLGRAREIQDLSLAQMRTFTQSIAAMMASVQRDRSGRE